MITAIFSARSVLIRELDIENVIQFRNFCQLISCEVEYIVEAVGQAVLKKIQYLEKPYWCVIVYFNAKIFHIL